MAMEQPLSSADYKTALVNRALKRQPDETLVLSKQFRPGETIINAILFIAGFISIFTTLGIVLVLGSESLNFFSRDVFEPVNRNLLEPITVNSTTLTLSEPQANSRPVEVGSVLEIGTEKLRVTALSGSELTVERGYENTAIVPHAADVVVRVGRHVTLLEFIGGTEWVPQGGKFGVLALVSSTLRTTVIAMLIATPLGLGAAIYLSEYASPRVRAAIKPMLEILVGVPTVVFGYFALTFMTPLLQSILGPSVQVYNTLSAGIVMGIMITPTIASLSEDALSAVPRALREASYGLGATKLETILKILLPAAISGIVAGFILGVSRAVGETMIVAIAAGAGPLFTGNALVGAETMAGHIVRISTGDLSYGSIDYNSVFAIGLTLFLLTLILNLISTYITRRFREIY